MQNKNQFANMILFTAILFGSIIRFAAPLSAQGPVNDGGLFMQMTDELVANHFALPLYTAYNHANIPFAYPPLGFYLIGLVQWVTGISSFVLFTYLPALVSLLMVPALYFLALELMGDAMKASIAALFYAAIPKSFDWFIMGGGIMRSLGILFSFLVLAYAHRLFVTRNSRYILHVSVLSTLLIFSHPRTAYHTVLTVLIFALFFLRSWKSVLHAVVVGVAAAALSSLWWFTVLHRYGIGVFQTVLQAEPRNYVILFLSFIQFDLGGEVLLSLVSVFALIGLIWSLQARDFFLPLWITIGGHVVSVAALVMLAVRGFEVVLKGLGDPAPMESRFSARGSRYILLGFSAYLLMAGIIASSFLGNGFRLLPDEYRAMEWVKRNTPASADFLIVTGNALMLDPLSEWFPALTGRVSLSTLQGHEWTPEQNLGKSITLNNQLQSCINKDVSCLASWNYDYVYIRKITPVREGGAAPHYSLLDVSLRESKEYQIVFENEDAVIYKPIR